MGKSLSGRILVCVTSIICVIALCIIANNGIPSLYSSKREKLAAQKAATQVVSQVKEKKPASVEVTEPAEEEASQEETAEPIEEDVVEIEEDSVSEEAVEEATEEAEEEETDEEEAAPEEKKSFFQRIIDFFTGIIDAIMSGDILTKIKDFVSGLLGL